MTRSRKHTGAGEPAGMTPDRLAMLDRLEVGPPRIEPSRVVVPYRVIDGAKDVAADLIYKYQEPVFDPADPAAANLAAMIGAQLALNYGLFFRRMVFHGLYDETDRRFLRDMIDNTSREVYVKKFLEPNPFLTGEAAAMIPVKQKRYTNAMLEFPGGRSERSAAPWQLHDADAGAHAILSSGGKDSLLTYGLLNELGRETHPIYLNESGRHWYTALNAYRHFKEHVPSTARVWLNSDRLFAWMLRHFPFIRKDFTAIRSDEYPVRLWTVAVFLFGALPILRKRRIGRLLIGDEYDTTVRTAFKGIFHYNGLYDQSRYFDNVLSRYFMRKGWAVRQFSILRPLSELLIEKILVERYPDLQAHQVSCHAAHEEHGRIHPCGRCEKCRRIVGMLTAIGADPVMCGYTPAQIAACLEALKKSPVHQESAGARHMAWLLGERGVLPGDALQAQRAKAYPEVVHLRFDAERSPADGIPVDLRRGLYDLCLEHADGALKRSGRQWLPMDAAADPAMTAPYPFEPVPQRAATEPTDAMPGGPMDAGGNAGGTSAGSAVKRHIWGNLTWPEIEKRLQTVDVAILPVGSIEQHGPHLPVDTDAFDADYLAHRVAEACSAPRPFVLPLIPYGVSYEHADFKGTVSVQNDTLSRMIYDIGISVAANGIRKLMIINGHGGNTPAVLYAAQKINRDARIFVCADSGETSDVDIYGGEGLENDIHAGEIETSTSLAVRPERVKMDRAEKLLPKFSSRYMNFTSNRGVAWFSYTKQFSASGVIGDPSRASAEKGARIWQIMITHLVALIEDLKDLSLDEIYQRKY